MHNGWTAGGVIKIVDWVAESRLNSDCHAASSSLFNRLHNVTSVTNIVCAATASFLAAVGSVINDDDTSDRAVDIRNGCITFLTAMSLVCTGVLGLFKWNMRKAMHDIIASEYSYLAKELEIQLNLPMHRRGDAEIVFSRASSRFQDLMFRGPNIPGWIMRGEEERRALARVRDRDIHTPYRTA
jgi:hypothetical protein